MNDENNLDNLKLKQFRVLEKIKKTHTYFKKIKFKETIESPIYTTRTGETFGFIYSNFLASKKVSIFQRLYIVIKNLLSISYLTKYKLIFDKKFIYQKIIITWAFKNNFKKNGSFHDRYFNVNSRDTKNTLWFVIFMDQVLPNKIDKNIFLFQTDIKKKISLFKIIEVLKNNFKYFFKDITYFNFMISKHRYLAETLINVFKKNIRLDLKNVLIPYEGQPFQNYLIKYLRTYKKKIKLTGYIHAPPVPFPSNYVKKKYSPSKIIVNGKDQIDYFRTLGWKKNETIFMPSNRFTLKKKIFSNIIFLPIFVKSPENISTSLKLLRDKLSIDIKSFKIKNHPAANTTKVNIQLIKEIKSIKSLNTKKKFNNENLSIFIGSTGAIVEALERGYSIIQVTEDPLFDLYSDKIWKSIHSKRISNNIFSYKLKKKGSLLNLSKKPKSINSFFNR